MVKPDIDTLLAELAQYVADDLPPVDEGWFTVEELMETTHQSHVKIYRRLQIGVAKGEIEKWKTGRARGKEGYYRIVKDGR